MQLMYALTYRKVLLFYFVFFGILATVTFFTDFELFPDDMPWYYYAFLFLGFLYFPFSLYRNLKKSYASNARFRERIRYEFNPNTMRITGESFTSELNWEKTYQVKELNDWILIYQDRQIANAIPKAAFGDQLPEFRNLVRNKNVKSELKA